MRPLRHWSRSVVGVALVVFIVAALGASSGLAQNKQGLGPGGTRLTPPPPPSSSGTGFGPSTGFGSGTGGSSSTPPGTRCVSIQCADGSTVPCNSMCPRPGAPAAPSSGGSSGSSGGSSGSTSGPSSDRGSWQAMQAANQRGVEAHKRGDYEAAAGYFRDALRYVPDQPIVRQNLQNAENEIRRKRELAADEAARQKREAETSAAIRQGVDRLAGVLGTPPPERGAAGTAPSRAPDSGLDFLRDATSAREPECVGGRPSVPNRDPNVVDLRCAGTLTVDPALTKGSPTGRTGAPLEFAKSLDAPPMRDAVAPIGRPDAPNPPAVDRGVVKEQRKTRVSETTLNNANYVKGFDAIRGGDHALAVTYFEKAQAELGNDVLVKNARALAEDLRRVHRQDSEKNRAAGQAGDSLMAAIHGDYDRAIKYLKSAIDLDPSNPRYRDELSFMQGVRTGVNIAREQAQPGQQQAMLADKATALARQSLIPWHRGDRDSAIAILEAAQSLNPTDPEVKALLTIARDAQSRDKDARGNKARAGSTTK